MKSIPLNKGLFAVVDDEDFEMVACKRWWVHKDPKSGRMYAVGKDGRKHIQMHRFILNHTQEHTDHADGNGLNNTRGNIRPATRAQNGQNRKLQKHSAPYKGVHKTQYNGKFTASIRVNKKKVHLGTFEDPKDAAMAYDRAAMRHFGEFARTNNRIGAL